MAWLPRPFDLLNKTVGTAGLRITRGIPYGLHPRHRLDVYTPVARDVYAPAMRGGGLPHGVAECWPVIVFFPGGSWQSGQRGEVGFAAAALAKAGFAVAVPDYRQHAEVSFPGFLQDCAAATAWVFKNIANHGGDDRAIFLMGHAAGAYNAAMLALDPGYLAAADLAPSRLAGWIGLAGPYDFLPSQDTAITRIFDTPDPRLAQPVHHVKEGAPPALLLHGGLDRAVAPRNTAILAARLRTAGNAVETRIYPKLGHAGILAACLPYLQWRTSLMQDLAQFTAACRNGEFADAAVALNLDTPSTF